MCSGKTFASGTIAGVTVASVLVLGLVGSTATSALAGPKESKPAVALECDGCVGSNSGGTHDIQDGAVTADKLSAGVRDDLEQLKQVIDYVNGRRIVFVTTGEYSGNLIDEAQTLTGIVPASGLEGGDLICQHLAQNSSLPLIGLYKAWLSTFVISAKDRINDAPGGYFRPDGVRVAKDKADLIDGDIESSISVDEAGVLLDTDTSVWTGTRSDGTSDSVFTSCDDWSETDLNDGAIVGGAMETGQEWTEVGPRSCDPALDGKSRIYCIQQ